jgi:hypothetical protein
MRPEWVRAVDRAGGGLCVLDPGQILELNLAAMSIASGATARRVALAESRPDLSWIESREGWSAVLGAGASRVHLASRERPIAEARALVATVDPVKAAAVVVLGFGLGHHLRLLVERMGEMSAIFVYEPDVSLLRAMLERVDCSAWLRKGNLVVLTDADDGAAISAAVRGVEGRIGLGVKILDHPASRGRLGAGAGRFADQFTKVVDSVKTTVVTTLMQSEVSMRNMLMNLDRYATTPGVDDLAGVASGRPAIVVAAGPSLRRNIELLARPGVRDRFVIVAVQTVLKQLLARGIRPHFVTSLDYHEISRRFYEGLTGADVDGVTLVAESQVNPAVLEAFPGAVRMPGMDTLDVLLGETLARAGGGKGMLRRGATVAHLAYYLARHLGCDPVIMMGQDLGFTDGQYYSAGAAIHQVWGGELNGFNTLEMMEWQRIVRMRGHLHQTVDAAGRPVYSDTQMHSYLVQFERDFAADSARGLRTIDATEGGVLKAGAEVMTLAGAIGAFGGVALPAGLGGGTAPAEPGARLRQVEARVKSVRADVWKVGDLSRSAAELLVEMGRKQGDQRAVSGLIARVQAVRDEVSALEPAFGLVQFLNQTGTLNRVRADREIALRPELTPLDRQSKQIERDVKNVRWLAEAADRLGSLLDATLRVFEGGARLTRDPDPVPEEDGADAVERALAGSPPARRTSKLSVKLGPAAGEKKRVWALVPVDLEMSGLGTARRLDEPFISGMNPLSMTLQRLSRCTEIEGAVLVTAWPERALALAGPVTGLRVEVARTEAGLLRERSAAVRGARLWSRACWRGGLASWTVYDEALLARAYAPVMEQRGIDAALVVHADWALMDPALADEAVRRYRQRPRGMGAHRMTFVHAAPGLGSFVLERSLVRELAEAGEGAGVFASIGGMVGYVPVAPAGDPLSKAYCVAAEPAARDAQFRVIPDAPARAAMLGRALAEMGEGVLDASAAEIGAAVAAYAAETPAGPAQELVLEVCTGRLTSGVRGTWLRGAGDAAERPILTLAAADRLLGEFGASRPDGALTLHGAGDPLLHPDVLKIVGMARRAGVAGVHIRTDLACEARVLDPLLDTGVDVISVDLMAESAATYRAVMGADLFSRVRANLESLVTRRDEGRGGASVGGVKTPWIVPRITRCEATLAEIEAFFDRWLLGSGAAVIDAMPAGAGGPSERIEPLPAPAGAARRMARERMIVLSDGRVPLSEEFSGERAAGNALAEGLAAVWKRVCSRRADQLVEPIGRPRAWSDGSLSRRVASPTAGAEF